MLCAIRDRKPRNPGHFATQSKNTSTMYDITIRRIEFDSGHKNSLKLIETNRLWYLTKIIIARDERPRGKWIIERDEWGEKKKRYDVVCCMHLRIFSNFGYIFFLQWLTFWSLCTIIFVIDKYSTDFNNFKYFIFLYYIFVVNFVYFIHFKNRILIIYVNNLFKMERKLILKLIHLLL